LREFIGEISMRSWIVCAASGALIFGSFVAPATANDGTGKGHGSGGPIGLRAAQPDFEAQQIGRVTAVDTTAMTLACHWTTGDWTYHITPKTTFRRNGASASLADVKTDDVVQVLFHMEGANEVADAVIVSTQ
jgi:hypothetical protein